MSWGIFRQDAGNVSILFFRPRSQLPLFLAWADEFFITEPPGKPWGTIPWVVHSLTGRDNHEKPILPATEAEAAEATAGAFPSTPQDPALRVWRGVSAVLEVSAILALSDSGEMLELKQTRKEHLGQDRARPLTGLRASVAPGLARSVAL